MEIQVEMLPVEERDRVLGKYMDAFSRMEGRLNHLIQLLLDTDWQAGNALSAVLYSKQRIDLLESLAWVKLPKALAERVTKACEKLGRRNMRRNHIVHGRWEQVLTIHDDRAETEWVRRYTPTNPELAAILDHDSPKLLGVFTFTIPALERATDHVEEMHEILGRLSTDIQTQKPQPPTPSDLPTK